MGSTLDLHFITCHGTCTCVVLMVNVYCNCSKTVQLRSSETVRVCDCTVKQLLKDLIELPIVIRFFFFAIAPHVVLDGWVTS